MLEDYTNDLIRKMMELRYKKIEDACKRYCIAYSIELDNFAKEALFVNTRGINCDMVTIQYHNKNIMSFKCYNNGIVVQEPVDESKQIYLKDNYTVGSIRSNEQSKAYQLIEWINENETGHPGTYADCIHTDILITKIKELFDI